HGFLPHAPAGDIAVVALKPDLGEDEAEATLMIASSTAACSVTTQRRRNVPATPAPNPAAGGSPQRTRGCRLSGRSGGSSRGTPGGPGHLLPRRYSRSGRVRSPKQPPGRRPEQRRRRAQETGSTIRRK